MAEHVAPEDCAHPDVAEDWHPAPESFGLAPPPAFVTDEGGVCRQCGARVVRHGSPGAWTPWTLDAGAA